MRYVTGTLSSLLLAALASTAALAAPIAPAPVSPAGSISILPVADGAVVYTQRYLAERGYYLGAVDGISGPKTEAAIRQYERAAGWPVTGDPYVFAAKAGYAVPRAVVPAPAPVPHVVVPPHRRRWP